MPPTFAGALSSVRGSGLDSATTFTLPPCGACTIASNTSSGTPLYFNSANTDGNVSKGQLEVLIFSTISAVGSFARTIVRMSALVSVVKLSWAKVSETQERERVRARRTDNRDLDMGDPFKTD